MYTATETKTFNERYEYKFKHVLMRFSITYTVYFNKLQATKKLLSQSNENTSIRARLFSDIGLTGFPTYLMGNTWWWFTFVAHKTTWSDRAAQYFR